MHYTLKHLRYVEAAERHHSITAAAHSLNVSASSIAAAIDHLDGQTDQPIFERTPSRGIHATSFGRSFIEEIRRFLAAQTQFDLRIRELGPLLDGTARIACFTPLAPILLPTILTDVQRRHPNLKIEIMEVSTYEIPIAIESGEADFALCYSPADTGQHHFTPLFPAPPHAALPALHPLASGRFVTLEQLAPEPLVALDQEHSKKYLLDLFAARGLSANIVYSARSTDMMRALIAAGMGYGVFNIRPMSKQTYATGDLVRLPLEGKHKSPSAGILVRRDIVLTTVCKAIIGACQMQAMTGTFDRAIIHPHVS